MIQICKIQPDILGKYKKVIKKRRRKKNEKHAGPFEGKSHTHTGQLSHDIPQVTGSAGCAADHQPQAAHDLHQSGRAARGEDRPPAAIEKLPGFTRQTNNHRLSIFDGSMVISGSTDTMVFSGCLIKSINSFALSMPYIILI